MHTAPPQSYLPLLARTTAQEDATTPTTRHVGWHPASHWWLDSYAPSSSSPSALFAPCPRSLLLADSGCWLWLQAPTSLNEGRGEEVGFRLQSSWDVRGVGDGVQSKWCDVAVNVGCGDPCAWRLRSCVKRRSTSCMTWRSIWSVVIFVHVVKFESCKYL
jgi:hypothetical protein